MEGNVSNYYVYMHVYICLSILVDYRYIVECLLVYEYILTNKEQTTSDLYLSSHESNVKFTGVFSG